jgi:hypothetical protein
MAQDLGLHRVEQGMGMSEEEKEMRRRVWAACVISDRWCALTYGHPYMIDVEDCDARFPSPSSVPGGIEGGAAGAYLDELVKLSLLLGRVMKMIYRLSTPFG